MSAARGLLRLVIVVAVLLLALTAFIESAFGQEPVSYAQNGRFLQYREKTPLSVPTAGRWFPEGYRIAPGPGTAVAELRRQPMTVSGGYGMVFYIKFSNYDPYVEPGRAFLESHIFEYDALIGQRVRVTWWQRVDGCCVGVVPMLMVNYVNGDYQFWAAEGHFLADQNSVNWPQQTAKDPAGYRAALRASPYCLATTQWTECSLVFDLPDGAGHATDRSRYIMLAMNFRGTTAAGISLAHLRMTVEP